MSERGLRTQMKWERCVPGWQRASTERKVGNARTTKSQVLTGDMGFPCQPCLRQSLLPHPSISCMVILFLYSLFVLVGASVVVSKPFLQAGKRQRQRDSVRLQRGQG